MQGLYFADFTNFTLLFETSVKLKFAKFNLPEKLENVSEKKTGRQNVDKNTVNIFSSIFSYLNS